LSGNLQKKISTKLKQNNKRGKKDKNNLQDNGLTLHDLHPQPLKKKIITQSATFYKRKWKTLSYNFSDKIANSLNFHTIKIFAQKT